MTETNVLGEELRVGAAPFIASIHGVDSLGENNRRHPRDRIGEDGVRCFVFFVVEYEVDGDDARSVGLYTVNDPGKFVARPWPRAFAGKAVLVDGDDNGGAVGCKRSR